MGDACTSDEDCSRTGNAVCGKGRCTCAGGYKQVQYMVTERAKSWACIPLQGLFVEFSS